MGQTDFGGFFVLMSTHKAIFMVMAFMVLSAPMTVYADEMESKNVKTLIYIRDINQPYVTDVATAMSNIYQNTRYDQSKPYSDKPIIDVARFDLNKDGADDFVAKPIEDFHEEGMFCIPNTTKCPHFIILGNTKNNTLNVVGIITANSVDVGGEVINNYKTLKAFTMEDEGVIYPEKFDFYETYKFDVEKNTYVNAMIMPGEKIKIKKVE